MERDYDEQPPPEKLGRCARLGYMIKDELGEIPELFGSKYRRRTFGGLFVVIIALLTWWTITRYAPTCITIRCAFLPACSSDCVCVCVCMYVCVCVCVVFNARSFIPLIANFLAEDVGKASGLSRVEIQGLKVSFDSSRHFSCRTDPLTFTLSCVRVVRAGRHTERVHFHRQQLLQRRRSHRHTHHRPSCPVPGTNQPLLSSGRY